MNFPPMFAAWLAAMILLRSAMAWAQDNEPKDIPIILKWGGSYPVSELHRLPKGQRESRVGSIADLQTFIAIWQAFKPGEKMPKNEIIPVAAEGSTEDDVSSLAPLAS